MKRRILLALVAALALAVGLNTAATATAAGADAQATAKKAKKKCGKAKPKPGKGKARKSLAADSAAKKAKKKAAKCKPKAKKKAAKPKSPATPAPGNPAPVTPEPGKPAPDPGFVDGIYKDGSLTVTRTGQQAEISLPIPSSLGCPTFGVLITGSGPLTGGGETHRASGTISGTLFDLSWTLTVLIGQAYSLDLAYSFHAPPPATPCEGSGNLSGTLRRQ